MSKRNRLLGRLQDLIKKRDSLNTEIKELEDKLGDQSLVGKYIKVPSAIGDTYIFVKSQNYENDFIKVKGPTLCYSEEKIGEGVYICFINDNTIYITDPKKIEAVSKEHFITAFQSYLNWAQENQELIINTLLPNE